MKNQINPNALLPLTIKTMAGLEELLAKELKEIGATEIKIGKRVVTCTGNLHLLYKANLCLRTALKVLLPIAQFHAKNEKELYEEIKKINWRQYLDLQSTFVVDSVVNSSTFTHSHYVALKAKDAIVDQFREQHNSRPSIEKFKPDLRINIHCRGEGFTLSLDSSGESLHKRGYRKGNVRAPLSEVLAAGMVLLSDWDAQTPFVDPMCGSGTIAIEAALLAKNIPPGIFRSGFGFQRWANYDAALWEEIVTEAKAGIKSKLPAPIYASDKLRGAFRQARQNIADAGLRNEIEVDVHDFRRLQAPAEKGTLIMNPPYGERLQPHDIEKLYSDIGDAFKKNWAGWTCWMLSSNMEALKNVGLKTSAKIPLYNGKLECRFAKFEIYEGSKRD